MFSKKRIICEETADGSSLFLGANGNEKGSDSSLFLVSKYVKFCRRWEMMDLRDAEFDKEVGLRILKIRCERGYSREQLAELAGISSKFLYEIETGRKTFTVRIAQNLSNALEVGTDYLLKGKKEGNSGDLGDVVELFEAEQMVKIEALLRAAYELSEVHKKG